MWGVGLALLLVAGGVALLLLGLDAREAADARQEAALFAWVPQNESGPASDAFLNCSTFAFAMDAPEFASFHLWNVTNAEELLAGGSGSVVQPELQQLGPYTYEKRSRKRNVRFSALDDASYGVVSYDVVTTFHYSSERSNGSESDGVMALNATYARRLAKLHAQSGRSERFLGAEFAHRHLSDYTRHLQSSFLATAKTRALRALLPEMATGVKLEGLAAVVERQRKRVVDAGLPAALVRMRAVARTEQIPVFLRDVYRDVADVTLPKLLAAEVARARRQAVPRVLGNMFSRLLVEAVPTLLDRQLEAQQLRFVPRALQSVDLKMQRLAFPYVLLEVFERTSLETVPLLLRAIKNEIVARNIADNQLVADDAQLALVELWRLWGSNPTDLDAWVDDSPTGQPRTGFELLPATLELQLSREVATLLLGSRPSNLRFSLVDYDAVQTAADGLAGPQTTPEGFAIWKQVVALNETAVAYVLQGVNEDVALESDYLTRDQLLAVRDYLIGWAQSAIIQRDRQRFWRKAFTRRTVNSDVDDPDVDLDSEQLGIQTGFSLQPLSAAASPTVAVAVAVAERLWNASDPSAFVNPAGFSKWLDVLDGVSSSSELQADVSGLTDTDVAAISAWITDLLNDGFVRRRALRHWADGTCLSVLGVPREGGCLRYDLEPNVDGQQLGFEMNPEAVAEVGSGLSQTAREALWNVSDAATSFLVPAHPSDTTSGYGWWLQAIRTGDFTRLVGDSQQLTALGVSEVSAQASAAWLSDWADNELNGLAVKNWWTSNTCWPREELNRSAVSTTVTSGQAACPESPDEQELSSTPLTAAETSPYFTYEKTFQVTEVTCEMDVLAAAGAQYSVTRVTYTLAARVFSCDVLSTGLADDLDDGTTGFELLPLAQDPTERIGLAAAVVLWDPESVVSFRNTQGYERWVRLASSIREDGAAAAATDIQAMATQVNSEMALVCQQGVAGGGLHSAVFNVSLVATSCVPVTSAHVSSVALWVEQQGGDLWVRNTLLDQWRRGAAGDLDIEPYRDGSQSGLELATGCDVALSASTSSECSAITTENGTQYEVPREALALWESSTSTTSFLSAPGYALWDALASATESGDATAVAASRQAITTLADASSTWEVWMERVFQWLQQWKSNEHLERDVLGHWLYASCPTTPVTLAEQPAASPQSSVESSCSPSYTVSLSESLADLQQLASRPVTFFDADVAQHAALVQPNKTVNVTETWVECASLTSANFTKTVTTRRSQQRFQACNLLRVLATPELAPPLVAPSDATFELNGSVGAAISLAIAQEIWSPQSVFSLINATSFFANWYPAIDGSLSLQQLQDELNALEDGASPSELAEVQRYLMAWESSDAAASSVISAWISTGPASVDVDVHEDGDQRGFELYWSAAYKGTAAFVALPSLQQAKTLWRSDSKYSLVRSDGQTDEAGLPTGFRAWQEMYEGVDWESEQLTPQYPLKQQLSCSNTMTHFLSAQQRGELLTAMKSATTLSEPQVRGVARWLLGWATKDTMLDFVQLQWATGETLRGASTANVDLSAQLERLFGFPVASDGEQRDVFTMASPLFLADVDRSALRKLWDVGTTGSLLDPASRVVWCLVQVPGDTATMAPCAQLLDDYGGLDSAAVVEFVALVQPTTPDQPIAQPTTADLSALAITFLQQALGLRPEQLQAVARWYRNVPETSLFFQVSQLDDWSAADAEPSRDPLLFGFNLAFVLPWDAPVARNVSIDDLVANTAVLSGSQAKTTLGECNHSLSLLQTLWNGSNPVSFLQSEGAAKWLQYARGEVDEAELIGSGASADNPTAKVIEEQQIAASTVSCLLPMVAHWVGSWASHPCVRLFVEEFWVAAITQDASTSTASLLPTASDRTRAFSLPVLASEGGTVAGELLSSADWATAASRVLLDETEPTAFVNPSEGFALWQALLTGCSSSNRTTGSCQPSDESSELEAQATKALQVLSQSLRDRLVNVSPALSGGSDNALLNITSSMIQQHIRPWLLGLMDDAVLEQYVLERVRLANGDAVNGEGPANFRDLAAVQFANGSVTRANYTVRDSGTGVVVLEDDGVTSERFPREEFVFDPLEDAVVQRNSSFSPGFGELSAFCAENSHDRRFAYDAETSCGFGTEYTLSIDEVATLWSAFGVEDATAWMWPVPNGSVWATASGVPPPTALSNTTRAALLLDAFLAQPFSSMDSCNVLMATVTEAYDSDWSSEQKQQICQDRTGAAGIQAAAAVYLRLPMLTAFETKPIAFVRDLQAYLRYAATKFGYEPMVLGLAPTPPLQDALPSASLVYPTGGYFAMQTAAQVLFGSRLSEADGTPEETPLWANATATERGASAFELLLPLEKDSALYRSPKKVVGQLRAVDNRTLLDAWGEAVELSSVRVTDGSQFTTAMLIGQGENTASIREFPPQKLYMYWAYARRVVQITFEKNITRFGLSLMRYQTNWTLPSSLPTGLMDSASPPTAGSLNVSFLNDDLPLVLQGSSSLESPESVIDVSPLTGTALHRRFVWQLAAHVGDNASARVLDVWHPDLASSWLPVVWVQEEDGISATASAQLTDLGPFSPKALAMWGIVGGSCLLAVGCLLSYVSIRRMRLVRLQRFRSIVPEGAAAIVPNGQDV
ncbi:hypothetical protein BBJ28_00015765, partial [Nothophytophthora sp. Chile5]